MFRESYTAGRKSEDDIEVPVNKRALRLFGHIARMEENHVANWVLMAEKVEAGGYGVH